MAEMEWFPFYAQDFLTSRKVRLMSDANVGRYIKLLAESWVHGPLPDDMEEMGAIIGLDGNAMAEAWQELQRAFVQTEDGWVNERLEQTRAEQEKKRERYVRAGRKGAQTRWSQEDNGNAIASPMRSHGRAISSKKENREEEKQKKTSSKKRASQLPESWKPNSHHSELARSRGVNVGEQAAMFKDHHLAKGSTFVDWDRAFNTWLRRAKQYERPTPPSPGSQAAQVRNEKPRQEVERTGKLTLVGKDQTEQEERRAKIDAWKRENAEKLDELRDTAVREMELALTAFGRKPEVAQRLVETKVDEMIWNQKLEGAA